MTASPGSTGRPEGTGVRPQRDRHLPQRVGRRPADTCGRVAVGAPHRTRTAVGELPTQAQATAAPHPPAAPVVRRGARPALTGGGPGADLRRRRRPDRHGAGRGVGRPEGSPRGGSCSCGPGSVVPGTEVVLDHDGLLPWCATGDPHLSTGSASAAGACPALRYGDPCTRENTRIWSRSPLRGGGPGARLRALRATSGWAAADQSTGHPPGALEPPVDDPVNTRRPGGWPSGSGLVGSPRVDVVPCSHSAALVRQAPSPCSAGAAGPVAAAPRQVVADDVLAQPARRRAAAPDRRCAGRAPGRTTSAAGRRRAGRR